MTWDWYGAFIGLISFGAVLVIAGILIVAMDRIADRYAPEWGAAFMLSVVAAVWVLMSGFGL